MRSPSFQPSPVAELSPEHAARYVRQIMLREVGTHGQASIAAATARVGGSAIAELYALRAGFSDVGPGSPDVDVLGPSDVVRAPAARDLLAGARATLLEVRRVLDEESA